MDIEKLLDKNGNPSRLKKKVNREILEQILRVCPHEDENTSLYMFKHNVTAPLCSFCGKPLSIKNFKLGFVSKWCSTECRNSDPKFREDLKSKLKNYDRSKALEKRKKTNKERYGVEHQLQRKEVIEKVSRYNETIRDEIVEKIRETCLERYGVPCSLQIPEVKEKIIANKESYPQRKIKEFIENLGFKCITDRTVIAPLEIDVFIPELSLGFEVNGVFWHSSYDRESDRIARKRHLEKTLKMAEKGMRLVHLTDIEILDSEEIVFSMIRSILGKTENKIYARNCTVSLVDPKIAKEFLDKTHIQKSAPCSIFLGLFYNNSLCSVMGFTKSRFDKTVDWELVRFSSSLNTTVVGGFSKLLSAFRKQFPGSIVSYADFSRSNGDVYRKNGFVYEGRSNPSYRWVDLEKGILYNRHSFMRRNLPKILGDRFDPNLTEAENCWRAGYRRLWDCGQLKFTLR